MKNKAYFFTTDAIIALVLITAIIYLVPNTYVSEKTTYSVVQDDIIKVLSNLKIDEVNNTLVKELILTGEINRTNISVIEQISEFWVRGNEGQARNITKEMLVSLNESDNVGIWLGNQFIYSKNRTSIESADEKLVAEELISGVEAGKSVEGFSAKALLRRGERTSIRYIGGYVGDGGDISLTMSLDDLDTIRSAYLELATNTNFTLFINGNSLGQYSSSPNTFTPVKYNLSQFIYFKSGINDIILKPVDSNISLFIAGGYIKVTYRSEEIYYSFPQKYEFPAVNKVINIYDSFFAPAQISSITAYLHYRSNFTIYLNIGNTTIFQKNSSAEERINLSNTDFSPLNYADISLKTVPLRFGLIESSTVIGKQGNADVVLITDLSDSMEWKLNVEEEGISVDNCNDPAVYYSTTKRISLAKCLDKQFVEAILNSSGSRVALSAFYADTDNPYKGRVYEEGLATNATYLKNKINLYTPQGGTCICCAINDAYKILSQQSNSSRDKYIIVMTDGIPTHTCQAASGCEGTRDGTPSNEGLWLGWGAGCYGGTDDCATNDCNCAVQNANWSSCRARTDLNAIVHSIGFGQIAACDTANSTLSQIAKCGNGNYYASDNATLLKLIYENISRSIVNLSFVAQTAYVAGNISSTVYNDSYISFNYNIPSLPFGTIVTLESQELGAGKEINFSIPANSTVLDAVLVSYSGAYWTKTVYLNNIQIYNLSNYGNNFVRFGDPYHIYLPIGSIHPGNNSARVELGLAPEENTSTPSSFDKVIYTIATQTQEAYSPILPSARGCLWQLEFEDGSSFQIAIPANYTGSDVCNLTSYNENDAIDASVYNLLKSLDFNNNNKIDAKFTSDELYLDTLTVKGIPYMWFSTVQARSWR